MIDLHYLQTNSTYEESIEITKLLKRLVFGWVEIIPGSRYRLYNGLGEHIGEAWEKNEGEWTVQSLTRIVLSTEHYGGTTKEEACYVVERALNETHKNLIWRREYHATPPSRTELLMEDE